MPVIGRRELKLPREEVRQWLVNYALLKRRPPLRRYIEAKVQDAELADVKVDMGDLGEMTVVDLIMDDLDSYGRG